MLRRGSCWAPCPWLSRQCAPSPVERPALAQQPALMTALAQRGVELCQVPDMHVQSLLVASPPIAGEH